MMKPPENMQAVRGCFASKLQANICQPVTYISSSFWLFATNEGQNKKTQQNNETQYITSFVVSGRQGSHTALSTRSWMQASQEKDHENRAHSQLHRCASHSSVPGPRSWHQLPPTVDPAQQSWITECKCSDIDLPKMLPKIFTRSLSVKHTQTPPTTLDLFLNSNMHMPYLCILVRSCNCLRFWIVCPNYRLHRPH